MSMRKFLRNTARGGLAAGIAAATAEIAFMNMHKQTAFRLDAPLPWVIIIPLSIVAIYFFFASDKEGENANQR